MTAIIFFGSNIEPGTVFFMVIQLNLILFETFKSCFQCDQKLRYFSVNIKIEEKHRMIGNQMSNRELEIWESKMRI